MQKNGGRDEVEAVQYPFGYGLFSLRLIGSAMFGATFMVIRIGLP